MSANTNIEWTENTWNPLRARRADNRKLGWHCEKVSPGCARCYAETMNLMYNGETGQGRGTGLIYGPSSRRLLELFVDEKVLQQPLRWKKPKKIFPCSMTDLFADFHTDEQVYAVLDVMVRAHWHTYQLLTKRSARMRQIVPKWMASRGLVCNQVQHIWFGVSVEDQESATKPWRHQTLGARDV